MVRYTNISQIKQANKEAGYYWFSPDTVRFFGSKVETQIYFTAHNQRAWVESTKNWDDSAREYKVVVFNPETSEINYAPDYQKFDTKQEAIDYLFSIYDDI